MRCMVCPIVCALVMRRSLDAPERGLIAANDSPAALGIVLLSATSGATVGELKIMSRRRIAQGRAGLQLRFQMFQAIHQRCALRCALQQCYAQYGVQTVSHTLQRVRVPFPYDRSLHCGTLRGHSPRSARRGVLLRMCATDAEETYFISGVVTEGCGSRFPDKKICVSAGQKARDAGRRRC